MIRRMSVIGALISLTVGADLVAGMVSNPSEQMTRHDAMLFLVSSGIKIESIWQATGEVSKLNGQIFTRVDAASYPERAVGRLCTIRVDRHFAPPRRCAVEACTLSTPSEQLVLRQVSIYRPTSKCSKLEFPGDFAFVDDGLSDQDAASVIDYVDAVVSRILRDLPLVSEAGSAETVRLIRDIFSGRDARISAIRLVPSSNGYNRFLVEFSRPVNSRMTTSNLQLEIHEGATGTFSHVFVESMP